jgi:hypothetical protein
MFDLFVLISVFLSDCQDDSADKHGCRWQQDHPSENAVHVELKASQSRDCIASGNEFCFWKILGMPDPLSVRGLLHVDEEPRESNASAGQEDPSDRSNSPCNVTCFHFLIRTLRSPCFHRVCAVKTRVHRLVVHFLFLPL